MSQFVRDNVPAVTAALTVVSLALVVATVRGHVPANLLPRHPALVEVIPALNAAISLLAVGTIAAGWRFARRREFARHRASMVASAALFALFLALYLYRVAIAGPTHFGGPAVVETYLYLPVLVVHMALAVVAIPLVYYALLLGATRDVRELPATRHAAVGRAAASLWLVSFSLGIVVYLLLYVLY
ncbi:MAG: DUF420 domain-containing protein [Halobacteriaceae archaeon]